MRAKFLLDLYVLFSYNVYVLERMLMNDKLTLKLNRSVIEKTKKYARKKDVSLSEVVERYFKFLTESDENNVIQLTPLVKELSGIIRLNKDQNIKEEYAGYLVKKYKS